MDIKRIGSQPSAKGPAEYFTGTVRIDPLFGAHDRARTLGASVTFEQACSDTQAHPPVGTDPDRDGWLRSRTALGRSDRANCPGDVVWFAPGQKHWHGATATTAMTHIAIQEQLDGKTVDWLEQVSDEQYAGIS